MIVLAKSPCNSHRVFIIMYSNNASISTFTCSSPISLIASSDAATQQLKPLNRPPRCLADLLSKVAKHARDKWKHMGIQLNVPMDQLDPMIVEDPIGCYVKIFNWWQRNGSPPYTWATIIDALRAPIVGEVQLAHELEEWLTTVQAPVSAIPTISMLLMILVF